MIPSRLFKQRSGSEKTARPAARTSRRQTRLNLENLEDRLVPTVILSEFPAVSQPRFITAGPNNTVAFTQNSPVIGSMTYQGGYSFVQTTPSGAFGAGITLDQGNLWVTQYFNTASQQPTSIGKYGLGASSFPAQGYPTMITADSQGNLWYANQAPAAIVKLDPNNPMKPSYYPVPQGSLPFGITVGLDGNIWFTDRGYAPPTEPSMVGELNPTTGLIKTYVLPSWLSAYAITSTPTGVAFTMGGDDPNDHLGRDYLGVLKYDMSGFQYHAINNQTYFSWIPLFSVALGPDGKLWFTDPGTNQIGWASAKSGIAQGELPIPTPNSSPFWITRGPGLPMLPALWFTEYGGNKIGRIDFPVTAIQAHFINYTFVGFVAGGQMKMMVKAVNDLGAVMPGYTGTVHFSSTDPQAILPADYTFTPADQGEHLFTLSLRTAGSQTVTVTDTDQASSTAAPLTASATVTVQPAAAATMTLSGMPSSVLGGSLQSVTVTLRDRYGNVATGYLGTVHFGSSDPHASLPADFMFTAADAGVHTFANDVMLATPGPQSVTVTDTLHPILTGRESTTVTPGTAPPPGPSASAPEEWALASVLEHKRHGNAVLSPAFGRDALDALFAAAAWD
jgi:streptogramin lyase